MKIARRNVNNLRYTDDTTSVAEIEEGLKSLLMKVKEESGKAGLKLNIQNEDYSMKSHRFMTNRWGKKGKQRQILFSWAPKITVDGDYSHEIKRCLLFGRKAMTNLDGILKSKHMTL